MRKIPLRFLEMTECFWSNVNYDEVPCQGWLRASTQELCVSGIHLSIVFWVAVWQQDVTLFVYIQRNKVIIVCVLVSQTSSCHFKQNITEGWVGFNFISIYLDWLYLFIVFEVINSQQQSLVKGWQWQLLNIIIDLEWQQYSLIAAASKINFPDKTILSVSIHSCVTTSFNVSLFSYWLKWDFHVRSSGPKILLWISLFF